MASVVTLPVAPATRRSWLSMSDPWFLPACTVVALLLLGYHPAGEDGGIYAAATAARLNPRLFPAEHGFAVAQSGRSLFVPLLAGLTKLCHLPLQAVLLLTFIASVAATLVAAQALVRQLFSGERAQRGAMLLLSVALGLPVAGTSLYLADPYVTARALSTPLLLLALTALLRGQKLSAVGWLGMATAVHPLMGLCALPIAVLYAALQTRWRRWALLYTLSVPLCMAAVQWFGPVDMPAAKAASLTRVYWFPHSWAPAEWFGALAPPVLLLLIQQRFGRDLTISGRRLVMATAYAALMVFLCSCLLIHTTDACLLLARLQPLRLLHLVYCIFLVTAGGTLSRLTGQGRGHLFSVALLMAAGGLFCMQRELYGSSSHIELPGSVSRNGYLQAFQWIGASTPKDALFALDANYTRLPGEDAQVFRAVALRSALPDAAKDGGLASILPALAPAWLRASTAQQKLAAMPDAERLRRVKPLGATWIVLPAASQTGFECPYRNAVAQVCRLP